MRHTRDMWQNYRDDIESAFQHSASHSDAARFEESAEGRTKVKCGYFLDFR